MQKSEKFFIFSWKELLVIGLLGLTLIGFFFTLGLHYGKKLHPETLATESSPGKLEESPENVPARETLDKGTEVSEQVAQDAITTATQTAVNDANLKLEKPKPTELPKDKASEPLEKPQAPVATRSRFALQLGSYTLKKEAQQKTALFLRRGMKSEIRMVVVNEETRYRVVIPGFKTRGQAELRGKSLKLGRKIESFVVIKAE